MQLYSIYTALCIACDFAYILSASIRIIYAFTCIRYAPTRTYMHLHIIYMRYTVLYLHLHVTHMSLPVLMSNYMHYIRTYMYYMHSQLNVQLMQLHVHYLCDMQTCITCAHTHIIHLLYMHLNALHDTSSHSYQYIIRIYYVLHIYHISIYKYYACIYIYNVCTCITYALTCINKQLHALHMHLHV